MCDLERTQQISCVYQSHALTRLTLFVSSEHPDFNVGEGEDGDGLWNTLLKLVLYGCGS